MTTKIIPNTVAALDALPEQSVIRGHGHLGLPVVAEKDGGRWYTGGGQTCDSQSITEYPCDKWAVLWPVDEPEWTGRIVGGEFARGDGGRTDDCATCSCDCHDNPRPAGTYLTVKLDDDAASIRPAHVTIQEKP